MRSAFQKDHFVGYVNHVNPQYTSIHFPSSALLNQLTDEEDNGFDNVLLGSYLAIEGARHGFIGKVLEIDMPEKDMLILDHSAYLNADTPLTANVEIMLSFDYEKVNKVSKGLLCYP
ncbi:MAG: hypothetical protein H7X94_11320, partial [Vallitaleaceae bacterium]|nr:hypothetical protein [Vallitaleaceae bacterium]